MNRIDIAGLSTIVVGPADATATVVLLHGFGASGEDLVPLANEFGAPVRYVFPAAPLELGGLYGDSRAWWMIDLAQFERAAKRDTQAVPDGLVAARETMLRFLDQLAARYAIAPETIALGGFSQGAMLALDLALHREAAPPAMILMSGTLIAEREWAPRMTRLAGVPIVLSHGRADEILPFATAESLRDKLAAAGAQVSWFPFVGGHAIPGSVIEAGGALLQKIAA